MPRRDPESRHDGWANFFHGLGVRGRDPTLADEPADPREFSRQELRWIYRGDAIAARAIDVLPDDAMRAGWNTRVTGMPARENLDPQEANEILDGLTEYQRRLGVRKKVRKGLSSGRLCGGALGILGLDDGPPGVGFDHYRTPVNENQIKSLRWMHVVDRFDVTPGPYETDPSSPLFGQVRSYTIGSDPRFGTQQVEVHASRVIRFPGAFTPFDHVEDALRGWDDSVITRIWDPLRHFAMAYASTGRVLRDFSRAVYGITDLHKIIGANNEAQIRRRLEIVELSMSVLNAALLDKNGESFEFQQRPVNGLADLLDRFGILLAAATGMPITKLLGVSPGGLGTGDDEDRRWQDVTQAYQTDVVLEPLEKLQRYIFLAKDGPTGGVLPSKWSIEFNELRTPSEKEAAEIRKIIIEAMSLAVDSGLLMADEAAEGLWGKGEFGWDVQLDREARNRLAEADEAPDRVPAPGEEIPEGDDLSGALQAQRQRDSARIDWPIVERILDSVNGGRITTGQGAQILSRSFGYPIEEAERLVAA